jgi:plasmid stability protein
MAAITIRKLDETLKARLRLRAARHGRSMEAEARAILAAGLAEKLPALSNLADAIRSRFVPLGGVDLPLPPRELPRRPPRLGR